jgi:hypothetical protein
MTMERGVVVILIQLHTTTATSIPVCPAVQVQLEVRVTLSSMSIVPMAMTMMPKPRSMLMSHYGGREGGEEKIPNPNRKGLLAFPGVKNLRVTEERIPPPPPRQAH